MKEGRTRRSARWLVPGILCLLPAVFAAADDAPPAPLSARAEVRRRYLWIGADGTVGVESGARVSARVRRPKTELVALEQSFTAGQGGLVHIELRTAQRLIPGSYELEVLAAGKKLASAPFQVGAADEVAPATSRLRSWLLNARSALRDLAATLERAGEYHRTRLLEPGGRPPRDLANAQITAWRAAIGEGPAGFAQRFRTARMDFGLYEREVLLSPFDAAGKDLAALFPALLERKSVLDAAIEAAAAGRAANVPPAEKILALAESSAAGLELDFTPAERALWGAGPLAAPEGAASFKDGVFTSALGVTLAVSPAWKATPLATAPDDRPDRRFEAIASDHALGMSLELLVRELPDKDLGNLRATVETQTWEDFGNNSWMEQGAASSERCQQLEGQIRIGNIPYRLVLVDRVPAEGKRIFELRIICLAEKWSVCQPEVAAVVSSFELVEKK